MKEFIRQNRWKISIIITLIIIIGAIFYLYRIDQLDLLLSFEWEEINNSVMKTIWGAIFVNWVAAFFYNRIFPSDTIKITEAVEKGSEESKVNHTKTHSQNDEILNLLRNPKQGDEKTFSELTKGTGYEGMTMKDLIKSHEELKAKREKVPIAILSPELQTKLDKLFDAFRYEEFRNTIDEFLNENENIKQKDSAKLYYQKALAYEAEIKYSESKQELETAVALDRTNPEILGQYGSILHDVGEYDKAIEFYKKALKIKLKVFNDENHPSIATSYNNLGSAWDSKGEYDKAIEFYKKALKIDLKVLGDEHPNVAIRYNNLGLAWNSKGEYDKAIEFYEKALKIKLKVFNDENHPSIATSYNNLGGAWDSKGEYDKAIEFFEKSLAIRIEKLGKNHPWTIGTAEYLEIAKQAKNQS